MDQNYFWILLLLSFSAHMYPASAVTDPSYVTALKELKRPPLLVEWNSIVGDPCDGSSILFIKTNGPKLIGCLGDQLFNKIYQLEEPKLKKSSPGALACMVARIGLLTILAFGITLNSDLNHISQPPSNAKRVGAVKLNIFVPGALACMVAEAVVVQNLIYLLFLQHLAKYNPMFSVPVPLYHQITKVFWNGNYPQTAYVERHYQAIRANKARTFSYYSEVLQWGSTCRMCYNQSTAGLQAILGWFPKFTVHGLFTDNFWQRITGTFDSSLGGNSQLSAQAHACWPDVIRRHNGFTKEENDQIFWEKEWLKHGTKCPLLQNEYIGIAVMVYRHIERDLHWVLNNVCSAPFDRRGSRLLKVSEFLQRLSSYGLPVPAVKVKVFGNVEYLHELVYTVSGLQQLSHGTPLFINHMHYSTCTNDVIVVPCNWP